MTIISRFSKIAALGALTVAGLLAACSPSPQQSYGQANVQPYAQANVQPYAPNGVPQVAALGCPVATSSEMQRVFTGINGVDGLRRPLNDHGVPVDVNGNCLSTAPVPEVYSAAVAPAYISILSSRFYYHYYYNPGYVHVYAGPGIVYRAHVVPTGHVTLQTAAPSGHSVTVPAGGATTVRPGASAAPAAGPATTVRPGAAAPTAAPAAVHPTSVTPGRAAAPTTTFNRPSAPAMSAPMHSVTPQRSFAPTSTFSRPGRH
jgi:hypothetical protein